MLDKMIDNGSSLKGEVTIIEFRNDIKVSEVIVPNTTLRVGRRHIAAALGGGLISNSFDCSVRTMDWGIGGIDGLGNKIPVSEKNTSFIGGSGNVVESTSVDASLASGDEPAVIFHGALGYSSSANGHKISQIGLKMQNGQYWAITTFGGYDKDANNAYVINWKVYFL